MVEWILDFSSGLNTNPLVPEIFSDDEDLRE
jgi:hypothetical protein